MPDANGQMQLQDFRQELNNRGFDGYTPADQDTLINRGYFYVARKFEWYWRQALYNGVVPANGQVNVADVGSLTGFKNIEAVYLKGAPTATSYTRLKALTEEEFRETYWPEYNQGIKDTIPNAYYIDGNTLYLLPVMTSVGSATVDVKYYKRPVALVDNTDVSILPVDLDEAIVLAALIRCHERANELTNAAVAQRNLDEIIDDLKDLEETRMLDQPSRVLPDDTWL